MSDIILYKEEQTFTRRSIRIVLTIVIALLLSSAYLSLVFDSTSKKEFAFSFLGTAILLIIVEYILTKARLITEIREDGIAVAFPPIRKKIFYSWNEIETITIRQYDPLREYYGWGVKFGPSGHCMTTYGNTGIQLTFSNGSTLLIGTNEPDNISNLLYRMGKLDNYYFVE